MTDPKPRKDNDGWNDGGIISEKTEPGAGMKALITHSHYVPSFATNFLCLFLWALCNITAHSYGGLARIPPALGNHDLDSLVGRSSKYHNILLIR
jgi:hypothetical protein